MQTSWQQNGSSSIFSSMYNGAQNLISQIEDPSHFDQYAGDLSYLELILALSTASILGALIAYHPKQKTEMDAPITNHELRKTQIVICVAGAIMVALIQGSLERAFGLVGLGSFVRYRTALRNPFDLATIFILIGLGMACGLQYYEFALTITCFFYVLLYFLDFQSPDNLDLWTFKVQSSDPDRVERSFRNIADDKKFRVSKIKTNKELGLFHCKFRSKKPFNREDVNKFIREQCGENINIVRLDWEQEIKKA